MLKTNNFVVREYPPPLWSHELLLHDRIQSVPCFRPIEVGIEFYTPSEIHHARFSHPLFLSREDVHHGYH